MAQPGDTPIPMTTEFGYYPRPIDVQTARFRIRTLPDHAEAVARVEHGPEVVKDWIYAGPAQVRNAFLDRVHTMPYGARVFGLPPTHELTLARCQRREDLVFVVWCLSFFSGMRLTTTPRGFLDATPIRSGRLVDFMLLECTLADAVELALDYLDAERDDARAADRIAAVIHALFLAQHPQHLPFERFQYLYMALDACYALMKAKRRREDEVRAESGAPVQRRNWPGHAKRIAWMCRQFGLAVPDWADDSAGAAEVAAVRNDAIHEALFFGAPLGFAIYGGHRPDADAGNVTLQMQALVCRLLVAILGRPHAEYVRSPVNTRQRHPLRLGARTNPMGDHREGDADA